MKKKLLILRNENRLYIKDVDLKELKPLFKLAHIEVHTTPEGKHTGCPRHYIDLNKGLDFILSLTKDYTIEIVSHKLTP